MIIVILHTFLFILYTVFSEGYAIFDGRNENENGYSKLLDENKEVLKNKAYNEENTFPNIFIFSNGSNDIPRTNKFKWNANSIGRDDMVSHEFDNYVLRNRANLNSIISGNIDTLTDLIKNNEERRVQQSDFYVENMMNELNRIMASSRNERRNSKSLFQDVTIDEKHGDDFSTEFFGNRGRRLHQFDKNQLIDYENDFFGNRGRRFIRSLQNDISDQRNKMNLNDDFFGHRGRRYLRQLLDHEFSRNRGRRVPQLAFILNKKWLQSLEDEFMGARGKKNPDDGSELSIVREHTQRPFDLEPSLTQSDDFILPKTLHLVNRDSIERDGFFGRNLNEFSGISERRQNEFSASRGRRFDGFAGSRGRREKSKEQEGTIHELKNNNPNRRIDKSDVFQGSRGRRENEYNTVSNDRLFLQLKENQTGINRFKRRRDQAEDITGIQLGPLGSLGNIFQSRGKKFHSKQSSESNVPEAMQNKNTLDSNLLTTNVRFDQSVRSENERETRDNLMIKTNADYNKFNLRRKRSLDENGCEKVNERLISATRNIFNFDSDSNRSGSDLSKYKKCFYHLDPRLITEAIRHTTTNDAKETDEKETTNETGSLSKRNQQADDLFWAGRGRREYGQDSYMNYNVQNGNTKISDSWEALFNKNAFIRTIEAMQNRIQRSDVSNEKETKNRQNTETENLTKRKQVDDTFWAGRGRRNSHQMNLLKSKSIQDENPNESEIKYETKTDTYNSLRGTRQSKDQFWAARGRRENDLTDQLNDFLSPNGDAWQKTMLNSRLMPDSALNRDVYSDRNDMKTGRNKRLTDEPPSSDNGKSVPSLFWGNRGRRQEPLYVEEPHWVLVRRDKETANPNQYYSHFDPLFITRGKKDNLSNESNQKSAVEYIDY